ncbi:MAG: cobalt transporter CbiM [Verrucomicrobia bacterium]|nr:cobalt transporter CbiM [Verrucomicrobiota bacterium]
MHIGDGIVTAPVLAVGTAVAMVGTAVGLRTLREEQIPQAGVMAAVFFVGSLVHVPVGLSSVHLVLNGLAGLLLGWAAFPALLVGLFLQAALFGYGGLTTLGVNTAAMTLPGVLCALAFRPMVRRGSVLGSAGGFCVGGLSVLMSGLFVAAALVASGGVFQEAAAVLVVGHIPVMIIEGVICALCIGYLRHVRPQMLPGLRSEVFDRA